MIRNTMSIVPPSVPWGYIVDIVPPSVDIVPPYLGFALRARPTAIVNRPYGAIACYNAPQGRLTLSNCDACNPLEPPPCSHYPDVLIMFCEHAVFGMPG